MSLMYDKAKLLKGDNSCIRQTHIDLQQNG